MKICPVTVRQTQRLDWTSVFISLSETDLLGPSWTQTSDMKSSWAAGTTLLSSWVQLKPQNRPTLNTIKLLKTVMSSQSGQGQHCTTRDKRGQKRTTDKSKQNKKNRGVMKETKIQLAGVQKVERDMKTLSHWTGGQYSWWSLLKVSRCLHWVLNLVSWLWMDTDLSWVSPTCPAGDVLWCKALETVVQVFISIL